MLFPLIFVVGLVSPSKFLILVISPAALVEEVSNWVNLSVIAESKPIVSPFVVAWVVICPAVPNTLRVWVFRSTLVLVSPVSVAATSLLLSPLNAKEELRLLVAVLIAVAISPAVTNLAVSPAETCPVESLVKFVVCTSNFTVATSLSVGISTLAVVRLPLAKFTFLPVPISPFLLPPC